MRLTYIISVAIFVFGEISTIAECRGPKIVTLVNGDSLKFNVFDTNTIKEVMIWSYVGDEYIPLSVYAAFPGLDTSPFCNVNTIRGSESDGLLKVKRCNARGEGFTRIPNGIFTTFHGLETLTIILQEIRVLKSDHLQGASKLRTLDLRFNKIESIPDGVFDALINLRTVYLSNNHISKVSRLEIANIKELYLANNEMETIEEGALNLAKVVFLDLGENKLKILNDTLLNGVPNLREISFKGNEIIHIGNVFRDCNKLEKLNLRNNKIETIEEGSLNIPNLVNVDLGWNRFKILNDKLLDHVPKLRSIDLSWNGITHIAIAFGSNNIEELDVSGNKIEEGLLNLPNLVFLNLDSNRLKILNDSLLSGVPNLKTISLSFNHMTSIGNAFSGMNKLVNLKLSFNEIEYVNLTAFANLETLEDLNLSESGYQFPHEIPHIPSTSKLKKISLRKNSLSNPDIFKHLSIFPQLEELDASSNEFTVFNDIHKIKDYLPKLKWFDLQLNKPSLCDWIDENKKWLQNITTRGYGSHRDE